MSDKQDDELYDEILEDSFEDDGSFDADYPDDLESFDDFDAMPDGDMEEPWDDSASDPAFDEKLLRKEKKGLNLSFNTIMITGAIIVGGVFLVYNVMSSQPTAMGQRFVSALQFTGATDDVIYGEDSSTKREDPSEIALNQSPSEVAGQADVKEEGFLFEPDVLDTMEMNLVDVNLDQAASSPSEQEGTHRKNLNNSDDLVGGEELEVVDFLQPVSQLENVPRAPDISQTSEVEIIENIVEAPNSTPTPQIQENVDSSVVLEPELDKDSEIEIVVQQAPVEPTLTTHKADNNNNGASLEAKLDLIATRLDAMENQIESVKDSNNEKIDEISATLGALDVKVNKMQQGSAKTSPVKSAAKASAKKVASKAPKKAIRKSSPPPAPKISWELRAAQPGKAWVSRIGQKEMQAVMVGDNLDGVGRITAISYNNGRWLVQGSSGQIRQ